MNATLAIGLFVLVLGIALAVHFYTFRRQSKGRPLPLHKLCKAGDTIDVIDWATVGVKTFVFFFTDGKPWAQVADVSEVSFETNKYGRHTLQVIETRDIATRVVTTVHSLVPTPRRRLDEETSYTSTAVGINRIRAYTTRS